MPLPPAPQSPEDAQARRIAALERRIAQLEAAAPHAIVVEGQDPRGGFTEHPPQLGTLVITTESFDFGAGIWSPNRPTLWYYGRDAGSDTNGWWRGRERAEPADGSIIYLHGE